MQLIGKKILFKIQDKNSGNIRLSRAINQLIDDLERLQMDSLNELKGIRGDFEKVNNDGFFFVNIHIHRVLLLIKIIENEARVVWAGNHDEYVRTFKNNKRSIEKWLRNNKLIH
ncbi:type II toxin-antitoxin system HigB family toxin [Dyadobacter sp. LJ53]|uniref:type II toxin-antitoxin system HigB family toxin n=1 Tax=Dyadobacter chenwenxiniae TaxID=2906456 RepID=UPI001F1D4C89|nr:type II toxin-antitoxin system HigB family toxin [Dyadobacter chenwenxiniae]MCF0053826.1 type II toxin-antitoxin system HigB family toxin [Dyadobacter chenwenxiniae]